MLFVKKFNFLYIKSNDYIVYYINFFMIKEFIKKNVINFFSEIYIIEREIWKCRNKSLLKWIFGSFEFYDIFIIKIEFIFCNIIFLILDLLLVNNGNNKIILKNMKGDFLDELCDLNGGVGFYIVNNKGELFYIDSKNNINRYFMDWKSGIIFI